MARAGRIGQRAAAPLRHDAHLRAKPVTAADYRDRIVLLLLGYKRLGSNSPGLFARLFQAA